LFEWQVAVLGEMVRSYGREKYCLLTRNARRLKECDGANGNDRLETEAKGWYGVVFEGEEAKKRKRVEM